MAGVGCYHSERGRGTSFPSRKVAMSTMVPERREGSQGGGEAGGAWCVVACRGPNWLTRLLVCSMMPTASPFGLLVAALGADNVVGTDSSVVPLDIDNIKHLVATPNSMKAYVALTFRFRETDAPLDAATVAKLSDRAISRLAGVLNTHGTCRCGHLIMQRVSHRCPRCMHRRLRGGISCHW